MKYIYRILTVLFILTAFGASAQNSDNNLVQFSGVIVTGDSLNPVPFATVSVRHTNRGTITDNFGYFSFVANKGDTILFSAIGYRKAYYEIPDSLSKNRYSLIQLLQRDTIQLQETVIYPWPTWQDFKQAFINANPPVTDFDRAQANLKQQEMVMRMQDMPANGAENFQYQMQQRESRLYYAGQLPPNNLLNPFAWAQFIKAWKRGDFKSNNGQ